MPFSIELMQAIVSRETSRQLRFYQRWMIAEIKRRSAILLAAEMGLGKTVAVLTALSDMLAEGVIKPPILIIAPLRVAEETWPTEIQEWPHLRHLTYTVVTGTLAERRAALSIKADLHIINRENLVWLWRSRRLHWLYKVIVYDESSRLQGGNKKTAAGKTLKKDGTLAKGRRMSGFGVLAAVRPFTDRVIELSGTPAPGGLRSLWGPSYILDKGRALGTSKSAFEKRWFDFDRWSYGVEPKPHAFAEIMDKMKGLMVSLREEDYLTLPPRIDNPVYVTLPPEKMKAYRKFERTLFLEEFEIEALSNGILVNKLLQFANGSVYDEDGNDQFVHDLKLKALESIMEEAAGEPVLVAYSFKFDLAAIRKKFPQAVLVGETKTWMKDWNAGKIPMLVCHPASAGHGLNFQYGGSIGVWYGLTWSLELYQQFVKRLHRSGQKADRVWMHHILAKGTADLDVLAAMRRKGATQDAITEVVRVRLHGYA